MFKLALRKVSPEFMNQNDNISGNYTAASIVITISDLKDDYYDGIALTDEQKQALKNFDRLKVVVLSEALNDKEFQKRYFEFQLKENTLDYKEFLN